MAIVILAFPNQFDATFYPVTLSGGSWVPTLPLDNLKDPLLSEVARSTNATMASTRFDVDYGAIRSLRVFILPHHTISRDGKIRIRGGAQAPGDMTGRRNLVPHSQNLTDPGWSKNPADAVISLVSTDNPDGVVGQISEGYGVTNDMRFERTILTGAQGFLQGRTFTVTWWLRLKPGQAVTSSKFRQFLIGTGGATGYAPLTPSTQFTVTDAWQRFKYTVTVPADNTNTDLSARVDFPEGVHNGVVMQMGGVQVEEASSETTYQRVDSTTDILDPVYDTAWLDVWTVIYEYGSIPWEHPSFWDGKMSEEEAAEYSQDFIHVAPTEQVARYWRWEIDDTTNPDGYIDLARGFAAPGWQPPHNMENGAALDVVTDTRSERALGGVDWYDREPSRRRLRFALRNLDENIALAQAFEMKRKLGIDRQLYVVFDPAEIANMHRRSFLCTQRELNGIEFPHYGLADTAYLLEEVL